jgi:hypothetical protein
MPESFCQHITLSYTNEMLNNNNLQQGELYKYALENIIQVIIDTKTGWTPDPDFLNIDTGKYEPKFINNNSKYDSSTESNKAYGINITHNTGAKIQLCCGYEIATIDGEPYNYNQDGNQIGTNANPFQGFTLTYINNKINTSFNMPYEYEGEAVLDKNTNYYTLDLAEKLYSYADIYFCGTTDGKQIAFIFMNNLPSSETTIPYYKLLIVGETLDYLLYPLEDNSPLSQVIYTKIDSLNTNAYNFVATCIKKDGQEVFISGKKEADGLVFETQLNFVASGLGISTTLAPNKVISTEDNDPDTTIITPEFVNIYGPVLEGTSYKIVGNSGMKGYVNPSYLAYAYNVSQNVSESNEKLIKDGYLLNNGNYIYVNKLALNWSKNNSKEVNPFYQRINNTNLTCQGNRFEHTHNNEYDYIEEGQSQTKIYNIKKDMPVFLNLKYVPYSEAEPQFFCLGQGLWKLWTDSQSIQTYICYWPQLKNIFTNYTSDTDLLLIARTRLPSYQDAKICLICSSLDSALQNSTFYVSYPTES